VQSFNIFWRKRKRAREIRTSRTTKLRKRKKRKRKKRRRKNPIFDLLELDTVLSIEIGQ
jgi:uncharacterized membrane protein